MNSITVDKSPSVSSAIEGDAVTFTYVVRSPGPDALSAVNVVDDRCSPVVYRAGDIDGDNLLDPGEFWTYTCQAAANSSAPANIATATGIDPGGARVEDTDAVTITVVAPQRIVRQVQVQGVRLPRTGGDVGEWAMLGGSLMLLGLSILFVSRQRRPA
jgi:LPXTG-motif cell wall-anchored protein